ncbi:putative protein [Arabidopsis thaliana]|uniref:Uncharacterized protein AT4g33570 n=1 Tax=Arabidopsis thaliana TaxID=3702 RepID=O81874_ARATH|nr:putative protein [Arabidopsis thaliana]CAB80074.1 putative protein [Arabidopsis thaliana]
MDLHLALWISNTNYMKRCVSLKEGKNDKENLRLHRSLLCKTLVPLPLQREHFYFSENIHLYVFLQGEVFLFPDLDEHSSDALCLIDPDSKYPTLLSRPFSWQPLPHTSLSPMILFLPRLSLISKLKRSLVPITV